jgi:hypothetical protein
VHRRLIVSNVSIRKRPLSGAPGARAVPPPNLPGAAIVVEARARSPRPPAYVHPVAKWMYTTGVVCRQATTYPPADARNNLGHEKAPLCGAFPDAPEKTRTSTDHTVHKALNLGRRAWMR